MKLSSFFTLIYAIIVLLSGFMSFQYADHMPGLYFESLLAFVLLVNSYFMMKGKKIADYVALTCSLALLIFYGYLFSESPEFFEGVLTGLSVFMVIILVIKLFKVPGSE